MEALNFLRLSLLWLTVAAIKPLTTASGAAVSRYGLGGAARSTQPATLARSFCERVGEGAFLFFYSPDRYPAFLRGVRDLCHGAAGAAAPSREQLFVCAGGAARDAPAMERRLDAALAVANRAHALDCFVLEYVRPDAKEPRGFLPAPHLRHSPVLDGLAREQRPEAHEHSRQLGLKPGQRALDDAIRRDGRLVHALLRFAVGLDARWQHDDGRELGEGTVQPVGGVGDPRPPVRRDLVLR